MRAVYEALAADDRTLSVHGGVAPPDGVCDLLAGLGVDVAVVDAGLRVPPGRAVLSVDGSVRGVTDVDELAAYVDADPTVATRPEALSALSPSRTVLRTESVPKLLAISRDLESVAHRAETGRLVAGFQTLSTYASADRTRQTYRRVADRGVAVTVCGRPDTDDPVTDPGVRIYRDERGRFASYWFVLVDGGTDARKGLLVARETAPDRYTGWWTRRATTVDAAFETGERTYPDLFGAT